MGLLAISGASSWRISFDGTDSLQSVCSLVLAEAGFYGGLWLLAGVHPDPTRSWAIGGSAGLLSLALVRIVLGMPAIYPSVLAWIIAGFASIAGLILFVWEPGRADPLVNEHPFAMACLGSFALGLGIAGSAQLRDQIAVEGVATRAGIPLSNAILILEAEDGAARTGTRTDADGRFALQVAHPGWYLVYQARGLIKVERRAKVTKAASANDKPPPPSGRVQILPGRSVNLALSL